MNLSLSMICKNSGWHLRKTLESVAPICDEIVIADTGSTDDTKEIAKDFSAKVIDVPWERHFARARTASFKACSGDAILWLDDDDILVHPEKFRAKAEMDWDSEKAPLDCVFLRYDYSHDAMGNATTILYRERLVRPGKFEWRRRIHEILCPKTQVRTVGFADSWVKHEPKEGSVKEKAQRNLELCELAEKDDPNDIYHLYYAGCSLREIGRLENSCEAFVAYLSKSGYQVERNQAWLFLAQNLMDMGQLPASNSAILKGLNEAPDCGPMWTLLMELYAKQRRYADALHVYKILKVCPNPNPSMAYNPTALIVRPELLRLDALVDAGDFKEAGKALKILNKYAPGDKTLTELREKIKTAKWDRAVWEAWKTIKTSAKENGDQELERAITQNPPSCISDFPGVKTVFRSPKGIERVVFWCGPTAHNWGPGSLDRGVGGSEEAVIHLTRELAARNLAPEVYANTNFDGEASGVAWNPWWMMPGKDLETRLFVSWRDSTMTPPPTSRSILWLHDMPSPMFWKPEAVEKYDRVAVLSQFHEKEVLKIQPNAKTWITANGLDADYLVDPAQIVRHDSAPVLMYASTPERGLEQLLETVWPLILDEFPKARLKIFHGFGKTWEMAHGKSSVQRAFRAKIEHLLATMRGVEYHGMIGQRPLAFEFAHADFWLYPLSFPEISCITAMKAAAMGCFCVTSGYAALAETQVGGVRLGDGTVPFLELPDGPSRMAEEVAKAWNDPDRIDKTRTWSLQARKRFSWVQVADQWNTEMKALLGIKS